MADSFQRQEFFHKKERWREIVKRLLKVTHKHLGEKNLASRGSTSIIQKMFYSLGPWNSLVIRIRPLKII